MKERNGIKRKIAFLMAMAMISSLPQTINAGAAFSGSAVRRESEKTTVAEIGGIGRIEISLQSFARLEEDVEFTAKLYDESGAAVRTETFMAGKDDKEIDTVTFKYLADGTYTLEVNAPGFAAFRQDIEVKQKMYMVNLTADFCNGFTYDDETAAHPGVMVMGDVDDNGVVDDKDKKILIDQIDTLEIGGTVEESDLTTDLNNDKEINITDLSYLSKGYNLGTKYTKAHIEERVSPDIIEPEIPEDTKVSTGSVEEMLNGEGTVGLAPANGGDISAENPVSIGFELAAEEDGTPAVVDGITVNTSADNPITKATVSVEYIDEDGKEVSVDVPYVEGVNHLLNESEVYAEIDANGNLNVHLGAQVAVKKVTLTIMGLKKQAPLAEISKVEFVNGMEERIPEPEMDRPENLKAGAGSENFTVTWDPCMNVKGYEVKVEQGGKTEIFETTTNSITISSFQGDDVKNYTTYKVSAQSVNGTWSSGFCDFVNVTPKPTKRPDKPDGVGATGKYLSINVSWKKMKDTKSYTVYYKKRNSDEAYSKIPNITTESYLITDLANLTEYEIYVTGSNDIGESPQSIHCAATTVDPKAADVPKYGMINRNESGVPGKSHIKSVTRNGGEMVESQDKNDTAWGAVDNDPSTYYKKTTWDDGGYNGLGNNGLTYEFDDVYKMDTILCTTTEGVDFSYVQVRWWDKDGKATVVRGSVGTSTDANGNKYTVVKLPNPVEAKKIQIGFARYLAYAQYYLITVSDTYFYRYYDLKDTILDLYVDDLHTVLRDDVTQEMIDDLREQVNQPDEFGVVYQDKDIWLRELDTAEKILNAESLSKAIEIHGGITTKDTGRGFSGLNAWQPLGVTIGAGESVTIYVGHPTKKTGEKTELRLITTQYHSESGGVTIDGADLKVGANEFRLGKGKMVGFESGGAMYIQFQGGNASDRYSVRVSGGTEVPVLDLYKVTDRNERVSRAVEYIEKLDKYVPKMEEIHNEVHKGSENKGLDYDYDPQNCILGATDILLDTMMISLPAQQILAGIGTGSAEQRAEKMVDSMTAMEDMMYLFYQHKGLNASASADLNKIPKGHLNIRYQRMFSGAFMYASGNHIGIEWGSATGIMNGVPIESDEDGRYISGNYFGWGIGHEIGHNINQDKYTVAEITNNYFAQLAQAKDTNEGMRFQYQNIYDKVTSNMKGNCSNIATQLGMYWQLHLAYDKGLNYKTYANYTDQLANLFYARVDTYARNTAAAPKPGNVALTLGNNTDQNLMRLACAAANKNVLEFFERWGKTPDAATIQYAEQFEKESRAIFYANDDSRVYALNGEGSVLKEDRTTEAISGVSVNIGSAANKVNLTLTSKNIPESDILGYEITRCTISGGEVEEALAGFTTSDTFIDTVTTLNNRVVYYKVTLIDNYLNRSASFTTKSIKIEHDGSMDKTYWSVSASNLTADQIKHAPTEEMPCEETEDPATLAIDNDLNTVYEPKVAANDAELVINFNQTLTATGFKYTAGSSMTASDYKVYVMTGGQWKLAAEGAFKGSDTVYFANDDNKYISAYAATAVKLVVNDQQNTCLSIAEIDVLAPTGDNVDFRRTEGENVTVIGVLDAAYKYGENDTDVIPAGSLVFTGAYKGNPAYNVVMLFNENGDVVGGFNEEKELVSQQIILADVPDNSSITNVSDGTWIYWIEPDQMGEMKMPNKVRVELYRVNNAKSNEGERLVSDSLFEEVPADLPNITFGK